MLFRTQPQGVQLSTTSRQTWFNQRWTAPTATNPPTANLTFGNGLSETPTLTNTAGTVTYTGFGATNLNYINGKQFIFGVPLTDTAPDNPTLTGTNVISIISGRRSAASGRRNALQANDNLGGIAFWGQTATSSTGIGSLVGRIGLDALENFGAGARGTKFSITTINSGTTSETTRLSLTNQENIHNSDKHTFRDANGTARAEIDNAMTYFNADAFEIRTVDGSTVLLDVDTFTSNLRSDLIRITDTADVQMAQFSTATTVIDSDVFEITGYMRMPLGADQNFDIHADGAGAVRLFANTSTEVASFNTATITLTAANVNIEGELNGPTGEDFTLVADGTAHINLNADTVRIGDNNDDATITTHGDGDLILSPHNGKIQMGSAVLLKGIQETKVAAGYSATFAPDVSTATIWTMTLTGGVTFNGFTNPQTGQSATVIFTQDGTGSHALTSSMKFAGGSKTLTTTASATDIISVFYDGTNYWAALSKGYA
jgi:hypothetical protein